MPNKRIVFCCDGTSNTAYSDHTNNPSTNVWRISRYIKKKADNGMDQRVHYQPGLGTAPGSLRRWNQAWGIGVFLLFISPPLFVSILSLHLRVSFFQKQPRPIGQLQAMV